MKDHTPLKNKLMIRVIIMGNIDALKPAAAEPVDLNIKV